MTTIGIVNPNWTLSRHNTDHRCVVDLSTMGDYVDDLSFQFVGSRVQYLKWNVNFLGVRLLKRRVFKQIELPDKSIKADALYRYGEQLLGLTIDPKNRTPLVSTLGFPILGQDRIRGEQYLQDEADNLVKLAGNSSLVHFHTDCMREFFLTKRPEWRHKCVTVPFFLPQLRFSSEKTITEKFSAEELRIVFVGVDGKRKGLVELCEALDSMTDFLQAHQVSATFVSKTSPMCRRFKNITHHFFMERDEVQKLMQASHIYVMVPRLESFGLVFVEAMAAGCAVLADDDVPRQEIFDNGRCGRLVQPGNASLIVAELKKLIEDRAAMRDLALKGWQRAQSRYSPTVVAKQYADMFRRIIAK